MKELLNENYGKLQNASVEARDWKPFFFGQYFPSLLATTH